VSKIPKVVYLTKDTSENFFGDIQERFRDYLESTDRGRSTRVYLGEIRRFAGWITEKYGAFRADSVTPLDVVQYRESLQKMNKAPATVNRILVVLRVFFGWLKEEGEVRDNPVKGIKSVVVSEQPAPKWLTRQEQVALVHAVRDGGNARDEAMIALMLHAGLRVSEVCALDRGDIEISERKGLVRIRQGKGNKYRKVPLNKTARRIIANWLDSNPDGPLFPNSHMESIRPKGVFNFVTEYAYRAKIEDVSPHTLRHYEKRLIMEPDVPRMA